MNREYYAHIEISDFNKEKEEGIKQVCKQLWNWNNWNYTKRGIEDIMYSEGQDALSGEESEAEFTNHVFYAVWKANEKYCKITIKMFYIDYCETYTTSEQTYKELIRFAEGKIITN